MQQRDRGDYRQGWATGRAATPAEAWQADKVIKEDLGPQCSTSLWGDKGGTLTEPSSMAERKIAMRFVEPKLGLKSCLRDRNKLNSLSPERNTYT